MKKSIYSVFVLALISGFFFNGCKNFLSGSELKNQLEKEIAYENTTSCNVTVSSDFGKIANSGTYKMKASDPMTIEYSENDSGYQFVSWSCTPENSVTFSDKNSAKVTFTVKDSSKDISIFPELYKRLQITEVFPNSKQSIYPKDSSIIIKFSEKPSLSNDFSSIKIYYGYEDLTSYFKEPELRDNELVFTADRNNYLPVEEGTIKTLSVVIPSSLFYEVSGNKISLSNEYAFSYTINSSLDEKAPVINSLKVSRPNGTNPKVFPQGNLEQILQIVDKDDFFTMDNCVNKLDVEFDVTDSESGITSIKFTERLLYDVYGTESFDSTFSKIVSLEEYSIDNYSAAGTYTYLFSSEIQNGITELDISFIDRCGNETPSFTYAFIKKLGLNDDIYLQIGYYAISHFDKFPADESWKMEEWLNLDRYVGFLYLRNEKIACYEKKLYYNEIENLIFKVDLLNKNNEIIETQTVPVNDENFEYGGVSDICYIYKFQNVIRDEVCTYRSTIQDSIGNEYIIDQTLYPAPNLANVIYYEENSKKYYKLEFTNTSEIDINSRIFTQIWYSKDINSNFNCFYNDNDDYEYYDGYVIPVESKEDTVYLYINYGGGISANFSNLYTITPSMVNVSASDASMKPVFEYKFDSTGVINSQDSILKISFSDDEFKKYDFITVTLYSEDNKELYTEKIDSLVSFISNDIKKLKTFKFKISGIKDSKIYTSELISCDTKDLSDFYAPEIGFAGIEIKSEDNLDTFTNALKIRIMDYPSEDIKNLLDTEGFVKIKVAELGLDYPNNRFFSLTEEQMKEFTYTEYRLKPEFEYAGYSLYYPLSKYYQLFENSNLEYPNNGYKVCIYLEDNNGNYTYATKQIVDKYEKQNHFVIYGSDNYIENFVNFSGDRYLSFMESDSTGWGDITEIKNSFDFSQYKSTSGYLRLISNPNSFMMNNIKPLYTYDRPLYCASEKKECQIKNLTSFKQSTKDRIYIYYDQPVFFHRLVCTENFGDDIDRWERWTLQSNKQHEKVYIPNDKLYNFFDFQTDDIPQGMYYCYVAYFCDNTYKMSDVYYKN